MRLRWKVVVACTPAIVIQGLDVTMINLALPSMGEELSAQLADLQWIVAGFALAMVSVLPMSAAIGDMYGRRRALLLGYGILAFGSALAWSATSIAVLVGGRIAQGIGMALGAPNSFAMVGLSFPREERGRALGLWTAISSVVFTMSPLAGGWLVESFGFNAVFVPSLAFAVIGGTGTWMWMPADAPRQRRPLDPAGVALATGAVSLLSYGLIEGGRDGFWRPSIVAALGCGLLCAAWFARHELVVEHPMLDLRLIRRPPFGHVLLASFALHTATGASIFLLTIYLQALRGFSPWATAHVMLAFSGMALIGSPISGYVTDRRGFRFPVAVAVPAIGLSALAMGLAGRAGPVAGYLLPAMGLAGAVNGAFFVGAGAAAVTRIPEERTSTAAASLSVSRHLGSAFGIAVFGALATLVAKARFRSAIAGRRDAAAQVSSMSFGTAPEGVDGALTAAHSDASLFAFGVVMIVIGAGALVVGALLVRLLLAKGAGSETGRLRGPSRPRGPRPRHRRPGPERGEPGCPPPVDGASGRGSGAG